jgi:hypothetical protein
VATPAIVEAPNRMGTSKAGKGVVIFF